MPRVLALAACFLAVLAPAWATDYTWDNGSGDGQWNTGTNWSPDTGGVGPGSADTMTFSNVKNDNCTINAAVDVAGFTIASTSTS